LVKKRSIIGEDLNINLSLEEKIGGNKHLEKENSKLQELIDNLKLVNIEIGNGTLTWSNRRYGPQQIERRLDRFC
jgi:hypothetical protein